MTGVLAPKSTVSRAALATLVGVVIGMLTWVVSPEVQSAAAGPGVEACDSPAVEAIPGDQEVNLLVDEENSQVTFSYFDRALGEDRAVTVDYGADAACVRQPVVGPKIRAARAAAGDVRTQQCAGMRRLLTVGNLAADHRSKKVNPAAVKQYLAEWCGAR